MGCWKLVEGGKDENYELLYWGDTEQLMSVVFSVSLESPDRNEAMEELLRE